MLAALLTKEEDNNVFTVNLTLSSIWNNGRASFVSYADIDADSPENAVISVLQQYLPETDMKRIIYAEANEQ